MDLKPRHTVQIIVPVVHVIPDVEAESSEAAAVAALGLVRQEILELHGRPTPAWFHIAACDLIEGEPFVLRVGEDLFEAGADGAVRLIRPDRLTAAIRFINNFITQYDKALLFSWDDQVMTDMRQEALNILNMPIDEPEEAVQRRSCRRSRQRSSPKHP